MSAPINDVPANDVPINDAAAIVVCLAATPDLSNAVLGIAAPPVEVA